jgi:hypothetical protein
MEEFEQLEEARRAKKEAERKSDTAKAEENGFSDDEDKYEYEPDAPGQGYDEKTRTSTRNLRIREDIGMTLEDLKLNLKPNISSTTVAWLTMILNPAP